MHVALIVFGSTCFAPAPSYLLVGNYGTWQIGRWKRRAPALIDTLLMFCGSLLNSWQRESALTAIPFGVVRGKTSSSLPDP